LKPQRFGYFLLGQFPPPALSLTRLFALSRSPEFAHTQAEIALRFARVVRASFHDVITDSVSQETPLPNASKAEFFPDGSRDHRFLPSEFSYFDLAPLDRFVDAVSAERKDARSKQFVRRNRGLPEQGLDFFCRHPSVGHFAVRLGHG
jgi:hypothetical protein